MTVRELFDFIKAIRPGNAFTDAQMMVWLNEIEGKVQTDIMLLDPAVGEGGTVTGLVEYDVTTDMDTELIVPFPWNKLYRYFMLMSIDLYNGEYQRYGNMFAQFNEAYEEYAAWYAQNIAPANGLAVAHGYYLTAYQFAVRGGFHGTEKEFETALGNLESQHGYCNLYDFPGDELQDKLEYALNHYNVDPDAASPLARCVIRIPDITITRTIKFDNAQMAVVTGGTLNIQTETAFDLLTTGSNKSRAAAFDSVTFIGNGNTLFSSRKRTCNTFTNCNFFNCALYNDRVNYLQSTHLNNCRIQSGNVDFITCSRVIDFKMDGCIIEEGRGAIIKCYDPPHDDEHYDAGTTRPSDNSITSSSVVIENTMCESRYPEIPFQFTNVRPLIVQNSYFEGNKNGSISLQASYKYKYNEDTGVYSKVWLTSFAYIQNNIFTGGNTALDAAFIQHNYKNITSSCLLRVKNNIYQNANLLNAGIGVTTNRMGLIENNVTTLTGAQAPKFMPIGEEYWGIEQYNGVDAASSYSDNVCTVEYRIGLTNIATMPHKLYCKGTPSGASGTDSMGYLEATVSIRSNTTTSVADVIIDKAIDEAGRTPTDLDTHATYTVTASLSSTGKNDKPYITLQISGFKPNVSAMIFAPQLVSHNIFITQE